jgi:hypothetical protein
VPPLIGGGDDGDTSNLLSGSFLNRLIAAIRRAVDEPSINAKYTDADMVAKIRDAWAAVWHDLNANSNSPMVVRYNIPIVIDEQNYLLPPTVGQILRVAKIDTISGLVDWEIDTLGYFNPNGQGWSIEGNVLRLGKKWKVGDTMQVEYVPNGEIMPINGQLTSEEGPFTSTFTLGTTQVNGVIDTRPNAYAGYILRTYPPTGTTVTTAGQTVTQERVISAYDPVTRVCTLATDLIEIDLDPGETLNYEVMPVLGIQLEEIIILRTARNILALEGNKERYALQSNEYREKIRNARLALATYKLRHGNQFKGDDVDNRQYGRRLIRSLRTGGL